MLRRVAAPGEAADTTWLLVYRTYCTTCLLRVGASNPSWSMMLSTAWTLLPVS